MDTKRSVLRTCGSDVIKTASTGRRTSSERFFELQQNINTVIQLLFNNVVNIVSWYQTSSRILKSLSNSQPLACHEDVAARRPEMKMNLWRRSTIFSLVSAPALVETISNPCALLIVCTSPAYTSIAFTSPDVLGQRIVGSMSVSRSCVCALNLFETSRKTKPCSRKKNPLSYWFIFFRLDKQFNTLGRASWERAGRAKVVLGKAPSRPRCFLQPHP